MKNNQKGLSSTVIILTAVIVLVVAGMIFIKKPNDAGLNQQTPQASLSLIQNSNDLNTASADLDGTNVDSLDKELNQIDSDAATF